MKGVFKKNHASMLAENKGLYSPPVGSPLFSTSVCRALRSVTTASNSFAEGWSYDPVVAVNGEPVSAERENQESDGRGVQPRLCST